MRTVSNCVLLMKVSWSFVRIKTSTDDETGVLQRMISDHHDHDHRIVVMQSERTSTLKPKKSIHPLYIPIAFYRAPVSKFVLHTVWLFNYTFDHLLDILHHLLMYLFTCYAISISSKHNYKSWNTHLCMSVYIHHRIIEYGKRDDLHQFWQKDVSDYLNKRRLSIDKIETLVGTWFIWNVESNRCR